MPILNDAVPGAPIVGKRLFAIAAPDWTLMIAMRTAGIGGMLMDLSLMESFGLKEQNYEISLLK